MHDDSFDTLLRQTLDDGRLTRRERRELLRVLDEVDLNDGQHAAFLRRGFEIARGALDRFSEEDVLDWLLTFSKTLVTAHERQPSSGVAEIFFEPRDNGGRRLRELVETSGKSLWICVFTLTDDRLANAVLDAHRRGVDVRVITDDEKARDRGSDIHRMAAAGVAVRYDDI
ncbi:MAG: phospholipase D-like domain-containing protein, partial [Acidobacteriota bacterium]